MRARDSIGTLCGDLLVQKDLICLVQPGDYRAQEQGIPGKEAEKRETLDEAEGKVKAKLSARERWRRKRTRLELKEKHSR